MTSAAFVVIIPARLASTRLPDKPLADIGGKPMIVRVAERAARSAASAVVVAAGDEAIVQACTRHGVRALLTRPDHPSGSDRLAEAADLLRLPDETIVVNVQGDEPLIASDLINAVARTLRQRAEAVMATAAHPITRPEEFTNPNVVKLVTDARGLALLFSRAPLPWWRDGFQGGISTLPAKPEPLRHIGIYAYRAGFLRRFPQLPPAPLEQCEALEQLRVLWHGHRIAVHQVQAAPGPGVDTPQDLERVRALWAAGA